MRSLSWSGLDVGIEAEDGDAAAGAGAEAFEDFDGAGFAGAIGAEEAEDFACLDVEVNAFDGLEIAVGFL